MYDVVDGWGDESPFDLPVFVVTSRAHPDRPVLVGGGTRLFEHLGEAMPRLEQVRVRESPNATHIRYRVSTA